MRTVWPLTPVQSNMALPVLCLNFVFRSVCPFRAAVERKMTAFNIHGGRPVLVFMWILLWKCDGVNRTGTHFPFNNRDAYTVLPVYVCVCIYVRMYAGPVRGSEGKVWFFNKNKRRRQFLQSGVMTHLYFHLKKRGLFTPFCTFEKHVWDQVCRNTGQNDSGGMSKLSMRVWILPLLVRVDRWGVLDPSHTKTLRLVNLSANIWLGLKHWQKKNVLISVNYDLLYTIPKHVAILSKQSFRKVNSSEVLSVLLCPTE